MEATSTLGSAPALERAVNSLKAWGVKVNDAFFLGSIDKGVIMKILQPHIFFDDQKSHLLPTAQTVPRVHVPFKITGQGVSLTNAAPAEVTQDAP